MHISSCQPRSISSSTRRPPLVHNYSRIQSEQIPLVDILPLPPQRDEKEQISHQIIKATEQQNEEDVTINEDNERKKKYFLEENKTEIQQPTRQRKLRKDSKQLEERNEDMAIGNQWTFYDLTSEDQFEVDPNLYQLTDYNHMNKSILPVQVVVTQLTTPKLLLQEPSQSTSNTEERIRINKIDPKKNRTERLASSIQRSNTQKMLQIGKPLRPQSSSRKLLPSIIMSEATPKANIDKVQHMLPPRRMLSGNRGAMLAQQKFNSSSQSRGNIDIIRPQLEIKQGERVSAIDNKSLEQGFSILKQELSKIKSVDRRYIDMMLWQNLLRTANQSESTEALVCTIWNYLVCTQFSKKSLTLAELKNMNFKENKAPKAFKLLCEKLFVEGKVKALYQSKNHSLPKSQFALISIIKSFKNSGIGRSLFTLHSQTEEQLIMGYEIHDNQLYFLLGETYQPGPIIPSIFQTFQVSQLHTQEFTILEYSISDPNNL